MRHALFVEPLDTLFFRGSRALGPAEAPDSGLPFPQTFAGAMRTALLRRAGMDFNRFAHLRRSRQPIEEALLQAGAPEAVVRARFLGPVIARRKPSGVEPLYAVPRILRRLSKQAHEGALFRAQPSTHPVLRDLYGRGAELPIWLAEGRPTEIAGGYLPHSILKRFLRGEAVVASDVVASSSLYCLDRRVNTALDEATGSAKNSQLYALGLLLLRPDVGFYVEIDGDESLSKFWDPAIPLHLGGEARRARGQPIAPATPLDAPAAHPERHCIVLLTPGNFGAQAIPDGLPQATVRAASVGTMLAHSGFELARGGPHATRRFAPPGSTYFVEGRLPSFPSCSGRNVLAAQGEAWFARGDWS